MMNKMLMFMIILVLVISVPASATVTHRYDFTTDASDSVGTADGTLMFDATVTGGELVCDGTEDYLDLPGATIAINTYTTGLTLELWSTQPILNQDFSMTVVFGDTWASNGTGQDYLMIATTRGDDVSKGAIANTPDDASPWNDEVGATGPELNDALEHHYVLSVDDPVADGSGTLAFYIDGALQGTVQNLNGTVISGLANTYGYLGKGVYTADGTVNGTINDFRIHDRGLDQGEVVFTDYFGPDTLQPLAIKGRTPAYGAINISVNAALAWEIEAEFDVDYYNLYLGRDPNILDPSIADPTSVSEVVATGLATAGYNFGIGSELEFDTDYYWRVDTVTTEPATYQGAPATFKTLPEVPYITKQPGPSLTVVDGGLATFTIEAENATKYEWYNDRTDIDAATPTLVATHNSTEKIDSLIIDPVGEAQEGIYYCVVSNTAGSVTSDRIGLWTERLMAHYKFEGDLSDSSATGDWDGFYVDPNDLNPDPTPVYYDPVGDANEVDGKAIVFEDDPLYVTVPGSSEFFNFYANGFTTSIWYRADEVVGWRLPICKLDPVGEVPEYYDDGAGWLFGIDHNNRNEVVFIEEDSGTWVNGNADIDTGDGQWHMLTATYNPDDTTVRVYTDGELDSAVELDLAGRPLPTAELTIGGILRAHTISGMLDDVKLYSYALDSYEVAALYVQWRDGVVICVENPEFDISGPEGTPDCMVNLLDFAELAKAWLDCGAYPDCD